jgi:hypothetical protein
VRGPGGWRDGGGSGLAQGVGEMVMEEVGLVAQVIVGGGGVGA